MKKAKKSLLPLLLLLIVIGLWCYWGCSFPLTSALPKENWVRLQMWVRDENSDEWIWEIEPPELEAVLSAIGQTTVDRNDKSKNLGHNGFEILLYPESGDYPTLIDVTNYGKIAVAPHHDLDGYRYYERGEELFHALSLLTENLPPKNS